MSLWMIELTMTSWNNVGIFGPDEESILRALLDEFENSMNEGVVAKSPPTIRLAGCDGEYERKQRAEQLLHNIDAEVNTIVFLSNSNTADWGTGYIYEEPDDLRDITLVEEISGESGMKAADVESELRERGYPVSKRHYTTQLEKEDCADLYIE